MIEVEQKFQLSPDQEARLLQDATFLREITNVDIFYDTDDYRYTVDDAWLRTRNGKYELKKRLYALGNNRMGSVYDEIDDEVVIRNTLNLSNDLPMRKALQEAHIKPFAKIEKRRRSFTHGDFHIDLDVCDFGYELAEIELLTDDISQTKQALARIQHFAQEVGLESKPQRGKVIEYLYRFRPEHYQALLKAGVVKL